MYVNPILQPLSSLTSDHCPLFLIPLSTPSSKPIFWFESYWVEMPGFHSCVHQAWNRGVPSSQNPLMRLHTKLSRTAKALVQDPNPSRETCFSHLQGSCGPAWEGTRKLKPFCWGAYFDQAFKIQASWAGSHSTLQSKTKIKSHMAQAWWCQHEVFPHYGEC